MNQGQDGVQLAQREGCRRISVEVLIAIVAGVIVLLISAEFDLLERFVDFSRDHENWELDEFATVSVYLTLATALFALRRWLEVLRSERLLKEQKLALESVMAEIRQLKGIVPICAWCKRIRDDEGYWQHVEEYVSAHSEAKFSHGMCPSCAARLQAELDAEAPNGTNDKV